MKGNNRSYRRHLGILLLSVILINCGENSAPEEVIVDLSDAKAVIMPSSSPQARLDLQSLTTDEEAKGLLRKIMEDGTVKPVIYEKQEGNEKVKVAASVHPEEVFVGTDNKVYVSFWGSGVMVGGKKCCLIRGDLKGPVKCFGEEEGLLESGPFACGRTRYHHQVDSKGSLYFSYFDQTSGGTRNRIHKLPSEGRVSLVLDPPSSPSGVAEEFECYAVAADGTIYFTGRGGSGERYFRRKKQNEGVESLNKIPTSFVFTSNGDLFLYGDGVSRGTVGGPAVVFENLSVHPELLGLSLQNGIDSDIAGLVPAADTRVDLLNNCANKGGRFFEDASGRVYLFSKGDWILKVFPGKAAGVNKKENKPVHVQVKGNFLYYSGLDSAKKNIFRRIDLNDPKFPETDLLKGQEIEVYKFDVSSSGKIYFGGLKLPDNKYFAGTIDGTTLEMKVVAPDTKLSDLVVTD